MAVLRISNDVYKDSGLMFAVLSFLKREHSAIIVKVKRGDLSTDITFKGDGLPEGNRLFDVICEELVPNVLIINAK